MYKKFMAVLFHISAPNYQEVVDNGGEQLRTLYQEEVNRFSQWLAANEPNFADGLASWEKQAIQVYLYKKSRGLDEQPTRVQGRIFPEGEDGQA